MNAHPKHLPAADSDSPTFTVFDGAVDAPIHTLSLVQHHALIAIFFAGEMTRKRDRFVAEHSPDVLGTTAHVLHRNELVVLRCYRGKPYRYTISLTSRGLWFVNTIMKKQQIERERLTAAIEAIGSDARTDAAIADGDLEAATVVYAEEDETP